MTRRRWGLLLLAFVALLVLAGLESQCILSGGLRGEAFYRGRPTSYWRAQFVVWAKDGVPLEFVDPTQKPSIWSTILRDYLGFRTHAETDIVFGDENARPVLEALRDDPSAGVREVAGGGLDVLDNVIEYSPQRLDVFPIE